MRATSPSPNVIGVAGRVVVVVVVVAGRVVVVVVVVAGRVVVVVAGRVVVVVAGRVVVVVAGRVVVVVVVVVVVGGRVVVVVVVVVVGGRVVVVVVVGGRVDDVPDSGVLGLEAVPQAVRRMARSRRARRRRVGRAISCATVDGDVPVGEPAWRYLRGRAPRRRAPGVLRTAPWRSSRCARGRCHSRRR
jgi:hypothetical protein